MARRIGTIGYKNGFRYLTDGPDVYRNDYADPETMGLRWFSTAEGFMSWLKAYGPLNNEYGETATIHIEE